MDDIMSADGGWVNDLHHVLTFGDISSPRGMKSLEVLGYQSKVDMSRPIIFNERRKLGYRFMAAEAAWILEGRCDVRSIAPYSKEISKFSDDGETFFGAYGPPLTSQLPYIVGALKSDEDTRQAVATIWRQSPPKTKDVPCTVALQWLIRGRRLHCVATMRSSDLWLGHPYDIFNFSAVSFAVMMEVNFFRRHHGKLPLTLGNLYLTAGSKHLYERNLNDVDLIVSENENTKPVARPESPFDDTRYDSVGDFIQHLWDAARDPDGALALLEK